MDSFNLYNKITSQITELMQQHGSDWTRPWTSTAGGPSNALIKATADPAGRHSSSGA
jgi:antirestriction protein ArdC